MGMNFPELCLDSIHVHHHHKTIPEFLRELSMIKDSSEKSSRLDDYVKQLEDEMRKIDAFKRELPLCMILLNDAIVRLKEESLKQPVMEEFIELKGNSDEDERAKLGHDYSDKKSWMSSAQLWSANTNYDKPQHDSVIELQRSEEEDGPATGKPFQPCKYRNSGGTYVPFEGNSGFKTPKLKEDNKQVMASVPGLSLMPPIATELGYRNLNSKVVGVARGVSGSPFLTNQFKLQTKPQQQQQQGCRKQRRSWSQELHRHFVNALQQLGGSQAATPKQIRELMQVDGLTNDEVKSHLQKYRLHVLKLPVHNAAATNGLCMSQDQCGNLSKASNSQSSSPQGPLHLNRSAKGMSTTGCDSMEDEEDERNEGHSWKGQFHKPGNVV